MELVHNHLERRREQMWWVEVEHNLLDEKQVLLVLLCYSVYLDSQAKQMMRLPGQHQDEMAPLEVGVAAYLNWKKNTVNLPTEEHYC